MPDILASKERAAKKKHICSYCGGVIKAGEAYEWSKLVYDGMLYEWKAHKECSFISSEIWQYADPDEGMTSEDFMDAASDICRTFVCPDCCETSKEEESCYVCLHKLYEFFQNYELKRSRDKYGRFCFKAVPREKGSEGHG